MSPKNNFRKANVLAVDDQPGNLIALESVLSDEYNLVLARSGEEAISILQSTNDIDVILMDLQMPVMDGFEAAIRIKKIESCKDIPIIFITAIYKEEPFIRKGYEVGGVDYFSKPFDPEILKKKVAIYSSFRLRNEVLKERESHLRETEELINAGRKLSSVLESLPLGVLITDDQGRVCQVNEEVARIIKLVEPTEHDSYGKILEWWDASGSMLKDKHGPLSRAIHNGETSHNEVIEISCFDGSKRTLLGSAAPLYDLQKKIIGAVFILQDVTESKKIKQDLEQRITKLISLGLELEQTAKL